MPEETPQSTGDLVVTVITFPQLEAALLRWELDSRMGKTRTREEVVALSAEQAAFEGTFFLWHLLNSPC